MNFTEDIRYEYPELDESSLVIDAGFYKGAFTAGINRRYHCQIEAYEPVCLFFVDATDFKRSPNIRVFPFGVARSCGPRLFYVKGDSSGFIPVSSETSIVMCEDIYDVIHGRTVDLLKLNIEGMEFEVLERMIETKCHMLCKNIQVQFHKLVHDPEERYERIRDALMDTHMITYDFPWCWQNFKLK